MIAVKVETGNQKRPELIARRVVKAINFFDRFLGLIIRRKLKSEEGFLIEYCSSIHTFWMRYSIDAVFLDYNNRVVAVYNNIRPFRITPFIKNAFSVLELSSGIVRQTSLKVGDLIRYIRPVSGDPF
jgi:uncharacterized membrane protein (UPF0127 family)